jgi:hypothetical protein
VGDVRRLASEGRQGVTTRDSDFGYCIGSERIDAEGLSVGPRTSEGRSERKGVRDNAADFTGNNLDDGVRLLLVHDAATALARLADGAAAASEGRGGSSAPVGGPAAEMLRRGAIDALIPCLALALPVCGSSAGADVEDTNGRRREAAREAARAVSLLAPMVVGFSWTAIQLTVSPAGIGGRHLLHRSLAGPAGVGGRGLW